MKKYITLSFVLLALAFAYAFIPNFAPAGKDITLEDILVNRVFAQKSIYGLRSMNDGEHYTQIKDGALAKYKYATGEFIENIVEFENLNIKNKPENYEFSDDETKILFTANSNSVYRRSFTADYYVYDISSEQCQPLSVRGQQKAARFSPDGAKIAFVRDNNIFIKFLDSGSEQQITFDGKYNEIINGHADWVYEEEYELTQAFEWSPDSKKIAFYRFDESRVKEYNMNTFDNELYPKNQSFKYPKAGEENSTVGILVYDIFTQNTTKMNVGNETDQYIARIKWNGNKLSIVRLNRKQNHLDILLANAENGETQTVYSDTEEYYIERVDNNFLTFLNSGNEFLVMNERDGYMHLYRYSIDGKLINQVTKGNWEITEFVGCDETQKTVYYISCESSPLLRELYCISLDGSNKKKLSAQDGTNSVVFGKGFKYYINFFSNVDTPLSVTLHSNNGKLLRTLENNAHIRKLIKEYNIAKREFFQFETGENITLNGYIIKPVNFNENKKYPVLMTQYSGPGSQEVRNSFKIDWEQVLAAKGYIVVCVDGRGTGGRGEYFRKQTYGQLGKYEVIDQIETAKYIGKLPYADARRIGIWGWSFGGFMSLNCILQAYEFFKLAIAVAPVTNWRFYDSIYTELYNGLPQENPDGYDSNSPVTYASRLRGKLLIIHGTADDNVHIQNTYEMAAKLIAEGKQFDMMIYPDKNHSIYGGITRFQLFTKKLNYIIENL
ncbi:MAG: S9 family peptidase [Prevotellaceae bacterium]|jgi:dipeptidyl-peptidase-4|nr:S9 family peptidase [Prevotellaceae bacterium]